MGTLESDGFLDGGVSMSMALSSPPAVLTLLSVLCAAVSCAAPSCEGPTGSGKTVAPLVCAAAVGRFVAGPNGLAGGFGRFRFCARVGEREGGGGYV